MECRADEWLVSSANLSAYGLMHHKLTSPYTGTPAQISRGADDASSLTLDDGRVRTRKNTPGDQSMRRTIQDLVSSVDPNVKIEPEVEDVGAHRHEFSFLIHRDHIYSSCCCQ